MCDIYKPGLRWPVTDAPGFLILILLRIVSMCVCLRVCVCLRLCVCIYVYVYLPPRLLITSGVMRRGINPT